MQGEPAREARSGPYGEHRVNQDEGALGELGRIAVRRNRGGDHQQEVAREKAGGTRSIASSARARRQASTESGYRMPKIPSVDARTRARPTGTAKAARTAPSVPRTSRGMPSDAAGCASRRGKARARAPHPAAHGSNSRRAARTPPARRRRKGACAGAPTGSETAAQTRHAGNARAKTCTRINTLPASRPAPASAAGRARSDQRLRKAMRQSAADAVRRPEPRRRTSSSRTGDCAIRSSRHRATG